MADPSAEDIKPVLAGSSGGRSTSPPGSSSVKQESADLSSMFAGPSSRPPTPPLPRSPQEEERKPTLETEVKSEGDVKPKLERPGSGSVSLLTGRKLKKKTSTPPPAPTLIPELPAAWDEAHRTFETLEKCVYERKDMGLSREQDEMMVCDCVYDAHHSDLHPCGPHSDCINRALFIECLADECRARTQCENQAFSRRQYAPIEIVQTELKGFGLRAQADIVSGRLIYEYIGEVVKEQTFRKRMQQYSDEGIRHFYFMMLQKEEYIDATKKGGIGRFANHSCNPNCEVQKWVVGRRLRMGIFAKRDIAKDEEITFNYNVDRYGHDAQTCYCGEPNCVGTIGGKTQTDVGTINDLLLDALGITDEVEEMGMKGSKKKKARQLDEDFVPILRPIEEEDAPKVAAAMRQCLENSKMMVKLLQRVHMTEDLAVHRILMRMHGFSLMSMILTDMANDREIVLLALESMGKWKVQVRNKVEDSKIEDPVRAIVAGEDEQLRDLALGLLQFWTTLEISYRIPRVSRIKNLDEEDEKQTTTIAEAAAQPAVEHRRPQAWENRTELQINLAPVLPRAPPLSRPRPPPPPPQPTPKLSTPISDRSKLDAIIALAQQTVAAAIAAPSTESPAESSRSASRADEDFYGDEERRKRQKRAHDGPVDEAKKEKRLTKLVGEVVVRSMSKYKAQMDHETFKKYARECTVTLVEKEKRGHSYTSSRHPSLSEDKKAKIKQFTKDFAHKLLKRLKEKGKLRRVDSKQALSTPSSRARDRVGDGDPALPASTDGFGQNGYSTPSMTPGLTPSRGSVVLDTPGKDSAEDEVGLVDDIFGQDDPDDDAEAEAETDEYASPSRVSTQIKSTSHGNANGFSSGLENGDGGPNAHLPMFEGESGMDIDPVPSNGVNGVVATGQDDPVGPDSKEAFPSTGIKVDSHLPT